MLKQKVKLKQAYDFYHSQAMEQQIVTSQAIMLFARTEALVIYLFFKIIYI